MHTQKRARHATTRARVCARGIKKSSEYYSGSVKYFLAAEADIFLFINKKIPISLIGGSKLDPNDKFAFCRYIVV